MKIDTLLKKISILAMICSLAVTLQANNNMVAHSEKLIGTVATTSSYFGTRVDHDGDWLIVSGYGHSSNTGKIWFYEKQSDGTWDEDSNFTGSGSTTGDYFGVSVSISGDYAVVGASHDNSSQGEVYVYYNDPSTGWGEFQVLTDATGKGTHYFGTSAWIDGDRIVVGAYGNDDNKTDGGTVLVFQHNGTNFALEDELYPSGTFNGTAFGYQVRIDGERIAVGAPDFSNSNPGEVFVFDYDSTNGWEQAARVTPSSDVGNGAGLGYSLGLDGDTVAAGLLRYNSTSYTGRVYVYTEQKDGTWLNETILLSDQYAYGDAFGTFGLDANDGLIAVGAYQKPYPGGEKGESYVFARNARGYWQQVYVGRTNRDNYDRLGNSVSICSDYKIVGAQGDDDQATDSGAVYSYRLPDNAFTTTGVYTGPWNENATAVYTGKDVGIGTSSPSNSLHIYSADDAEDNASIYIENDDPNTTVNDRTMLTLENYGGSKIEFVNTNLNKTWKISTPNNLDRMHFSLDSTGYAEMSIDTNGDLEVYNDITAGGTVTWSSDRNIKENFKPVNHHDVLEKIVNMEVSTWNYIKDESDTPHIGPMAQDFYAAFGVGKDEKHISSSDVNGVAIASIKALNEKLETQVEKLEEENKLLKDKLTEIEALIKRLAK